MIQEAADREPAQVLYGTANGRMMVGRIEDALQAPSVRRLHGKVDLLFTSPPFPLVNKKSYGNRTGDDYLNWLQGLAPQLAELLSPTGSLVMEVGNAWERGSPTMSTLPLRALLAFQEAGGYHLCQQIVCNNPARLPSPAQWVTVERIRLKDSYTNVWWMSRTPRPKASNRRVLTPYGPDMKKLLRTRRYNAGRRPSGHVVSESGFLSDNGGAIASNVVDLDDLMRVPTNLLQFSNTNWDDGYVRYCKDLNIPAHPARMRADLAAFFIEMLTDEGDLVFDPFAGSNTTGSVAERLNRRWFSVEASMDYARGSVGRFPTDGSRK